MRYPLLLIVVAMASSAFTAEPASNDRLAADALKDVHDRGAALYNAGDGAGCLRMYQAGLIAVKPFLAHRPAVQKKIAAALAAVAPGDAKQSAFDLHLAIEAVRAELKTQPPAPPKAVEPPAPKAVAAGRLTGIVRLGDEPVPNAEVTLISLDLPRPRVFTAKADAGGKYSLPAKQMLPAKTFAVLVSGAGVPAKYTLADTSGLRCEVSTVGDTTWDFTLVK